MENNTKEIVNLFFQEKYEELLSLINKYSKKELLILYLNILEYHGGSMAIEFFLKTSDYFLLLEKNDVKLLISLMHHNPLMGTETLVMFYALHTNTKKTTFNFLNEKIESLNLFDIDKNQKPEKIGGYIIKKSIIYQNDLVYKRLRLSEYQIQSLKSFDLDAINPQLGVD